MAIATKPDTDCRESSFDGVHMHMVRYFPQLVEELGGDVTTLLTLAGLSPANITEVNFGATYRQLVILLEIAAVELGCPDFGMRLARLHGDWSLYGALGRVMRYAKTYGDALDYVAQHCYAHSLATRVWYDRRASEEQVFVHHDMLLAGLPNRVQTIEQIMLLGQQHVMFLTGGRARGRRIHFRHQPVAPLSVYRQNFGCPVYFGQNEDGFAVSEQDFNCPHVHADEEAFREAVGVIEREFVREDLPIHTRARGIIMMSLATGDCTNDRVAAELGMHRRTLLRKLGEAGTSFQKVKDEVRLDMMIYYLGETDLEFSRISERLGFSEQSVMTRLCHQWLAASPTAFRAMRRAETQSGKSMSQSVKPA